MTEQNMSTETPQPQNAPPVQAKLFTESDLRALAPDAKMVLPIVITPGLPRLFADTVGVSVSMSQFIDLTFLTMRQNLVSQNFVVGNATDAGLTVKAGIIDGGPILLEEGSVRLAPQTAVALISALVNQLRLANFVTEEILADALKAPVKE